MNKLQKYISNVYVDLQQYSLAKFSKDLTAGIITGIIAIPLSLALAIATGVPPVTGLYTAGVAGLIAASFAGSRFSVSGPAAAMVPILVSVISENGLQNLPTIGFLAGLILLAMGVLGLGKLVRYVPVAVTLGFTAGVAIVLLFGQLNSFLGLSGIHTHEHFHEKVAETVSHLNTIDLSTVLIGLLALAIMILLPKVKALKLVPPALVAVILTTILVTAVPALQHIKTIEAFYGVIPVGLPSFNMINLEFSNLISLISPAAKVAFLIAIETLLCAVAADKMSKTKHISNQELIAQGFANIITPFFGGIPATAVIARTGTTIKNGAVSRLASIIHALIVLIFVGILAPLGSKIPLTTLAAILFITAWKISEQKEIRALFFKAPKTEVILLIGTLLLTVFIDLTVAVSIGVIFAILNIFQKIATIDAEVIGQNTIFANDELKAFLKKNPETRFVNLEGNLTIGSADKIEKLITYDKDIKTLVIRMRQIQLIDLTGLEAFEHLITEMKEQGVKIVIISMNKSLEKRLGKFGILKQIDQVFASTPVFLKEYKV